MPDTTDLLDAGADSAPNGQDAPPAAPPRTRRRAMSSGLSAMVLPELQTLAGELGIGSTGRMRKSQLIEAIQLARGDGNGATATTATTATPAAAGASTGATATGTTGTASGPVVGNGRSARTSRSAPSAEVGTAPGATEDAVTSAPVAGERATAGRPSGVPEADAASDATASTGSRPGATGQPDTATRDTATQDAATQDTATQDAATQDTATPDTATQDTGTSPAANGRVLSTADRQSDRDHRQGQLAGRQDAGQQDREDPTAGDDRNERIDRGRERFLEREARRLERQQGVPGAGQQRDGQQRDGQQRDGQQRDGQQGSTGDDQGQRGDPDRRDQASQTSAQQASAQPSGGQLRDRTDRTDRSDRTDRTDRGDRVDRVDRSDRTERSTGSQAPGPVGSGSSGQGADEEEGGSRRGRFRERGRNRNRTARGADRFTAGDAEPVVSDDDVLVPIGGILDILDNYGFVRTSGYLTGPNDVYVSLQQVRRYGLRRGDAVTGAVRQQREGERKDKYNALVRLDSVNGLDVEESRKRPEFTTLTPLYPQDRLRLETESTALTTRVIDLVMPVGKGQRALIVSPPKAGKTMVMQAIANAIATNNPECHLMVVLVDERPEEVTDMQRSVKGEVIASTFDRPPQDHITVAELSIERAKRLVELGHDVVVLLDSITRLGRAYNLGAPASGRILTGGVDSAALYPPKRFLGAARNVEHGGSLTIFATALVETGSAMDTVIFEEFKGTGNAELKLDRRLADKRIFPAIDVDASGTRKEEILLAPEELRIVLQLRRVLHALDAAASLELLLDKMKATRTNVEFLMQIQKTTVTQDQQ